MKLNNDEKQLLINAFDDLADYDDFSQGELEAQLNPAFEDITDEQLNDILNYLDALGNNFALEDPGYKCYYRIDDGPDRYNVADVKAMIVNDLNYLF